MSSIAENQWMNRFRMFDDRDELIRCAQHIPESIDGLDEVSTEVAVRRMLMKLKDLFVVTPKMMAVLKTIGTYAAAASDIRYAEKDEFLRNCYDRRFEVPVGPPLCLIGPAGVGKSTLLKAVARIVPDGGEMQIDDSHDPIMVRGFVSSSVIPGDSDRALLARVAKFLDINAGESGNLDALAQEVRKIGYRDGVSGLILDEFQHGTLSAANSRVTSLLLTARATAIPLIFGCNFSLIHRLAARPQEDRDRLLTDVILLTPEAPNSEGWRMIVRGTFSFLKGYVRLDADSVAPELGQLSGCLPRNLHRLLGIAYGISRDSGSSGMAAKHIREAYHSRQYASARSDIKVLNQLADGGGWKTTKRLDLICPEEFIQDTAPDIQIEADDKKLQTLARHMLEQSMTMDEKRGLQLANERRRKSDQTAKVISIRGRKERTAQSLIEAHDRFNHE